MAKQETENSEDTGYIRQVEQASTTMASSVPPMVESAKSLAKNITHPGLVADWRKNNTLVSETFFVSYFWVYSSSSSAFTSRLIKFTITYKR